MNPYIGHRGVERLLHATLICLEAIGICHEGLGNLSVPRGRGGRSRQAMKMRCGRPYIPTLCNTS